MPLFEYHCDDCGTLFEEIASADATVPCPKCASANTTRLMSAVRHCGGSSGSMADFGSDVRPPSGGGCSGCSGGHCGSCGHGGN